MLSSWNPNRIIKKIPFNIALCGGRRMGKSTAVADLVFRMRKEFQLMICFVGSAACNDGTLLGRSVLLPGLEHRNDGNSLQATRGLKKKKGRTKGLHFGGRRCNAEDQLAHLAMRGRHFNISLFMCAVSYTTLPKRVRRSLDVLLVYSCPMTGDRKVLIWEFCNQTKMAEYVLKNLGDYECLVMETLSKRQQLFIWKANVIGNTPNAERTAQAESGTLASPEKSSECREEANQTGNAGSPGRTGLPENLSDVSEQS